jgi:N6-L-threonylcarbamoyladenine synthase
MKILSIETSCDETAISIMEVSGSKAAPKIKILSNVLRSQIELHKEFGGVYPNLAKREHAKNLPPILLENLKSANLIKETFSPLSEDQKNILKETLSHESGLAEEIIKIAESIDKPDIDYIAVTTGPGLEPALWVGINFAKALNKIWNIPLVPVNHMEGHVLSVLIDSKKTEDQEIDLSSFEFPSLALLISGGHTELVLIEDWKDYKKIGATRDDAVGEAFDKTARLLGIPYPGGPEVSRIARLGQKRDDIKLPRPMIGTNDYDFSFSGIKTSVLNLVKKLGEIDEQTKSDIAREFEEAVTEVLVHKTKKAIEEFGVKNLIIGGGVSANSHIKTEMKKMLEENNFGVNLFVPDSHLSTDNSVMIGIAGLFQIHSGVALPEPETLKADSNLSL